MNSWTEERVERLKVLWAEGQSCGQIAKALNCGLSRCAIIGKIHRLGLPGRNTEFRTKRARVYTPPKMPRMAVVKAVTGPVVEEDPVILADGNHVTIMTVTDRMCRWPIGDPASSDFHFCGRSPKSGSPYCEAHARKAYQPQMTAASRQKAEAVDTRTQDRLMRRMGL